MGWCDREEACEKRFSECGCVCACACVCVCRFQWIFAFSLTLYSVYSSIYNTHTHASHELIHSHVYLIYIQNRWINTRKTGSRYCFIFATYCLLPANRSRRPISSHHKQLYSLVEKHFRIFFSDIRKRILCTHLFICLSVRIKRVLAHQPNYFLQPDSCSGLFSYFVLH